LALRKMSLVLSLALYLVLVRCSGEIVISVKFISMTGNALLGGLSLFVMGLGAGMPLVLVGVGADKLVHDWWMDDESFPNIWCNDAWNGNLYFKRSFK